MKDKLTHKQQTLCKHVIKSNEDHTHLLDMELHYFHYKRVILEPTEYKKARIERMDLFLYEIYKDTVLRSRLGNGDDGRMYTFISKNNREILLSNHKLVIDSLKFMIDNDYLITFESNNVNSKNSRQHYTQYQLTQKSIDNIESQKDLFLPTNNNVFKSILKYRATVNCSWLIFAFYQQQDMYFDVSETAFKQDWTSIGRYDAWKEKNALKQKDLSFENYLKIRDNQWKQIDSYNNASIQERAASWSTDRFGERTHCIFTRVITFARKYITNASGALDNSVHIDLNQSQPRMIAQLLYNEMGDNEFTCFINNDNRVYDIFNGDKSKFLQCMYGKFTLDTIQDEFGYDVKSAIDTLKTSKKYTPTYNTQKLQPVLNDETGKYTFNTHKQLSMNLQRMESKMFKEIAHALNVKLPDVKFVMVHDCVIVPSECQVEVKAICKEICEKYLTDVYVDFKSEISSTL